MFISESESPQRKHVPSKHKPPPVVKVCGGVSETLRSDWRIRDPRYPLDRIMQTDWQQGVLSADVRASLVLGAPEARVCARFCLPLKDHCRRRIH